jgi:hypothetical protein
MFKSHRRSSSFHHLYSGLTLQHLCFPMNTRTNITYLPYLLLTLETLAIIIPCRIPTAYVI